MKYIIFLFFFLCQISLGKDVVYDITGVIKYSPCETVILNNNQNALFLGVYNSNLLSSIGHQTDLVKFSIQLEKCPSNLTNVEFEFNGYSDIINPDLISIEDGGAKNVGIAIFEDDKSTMIPINSKSKKRTLISTDINTFDFYACYISTGKVSSGKANSSATVSISYN